MGVLLGFGNTQLRFTPQREDLRKAVVQGLRRKRAGSTDICRVLGGGDEARQVRDMTPIEAVKAGIQESPAELARPVCTEVHEQHGIAVGDANFRFVRSAHKGRCDELIALVPLIGGMQAIDRGDGRIFGFRPGQHSPGLFGAFPAVVPVHGIVTPDDTGNAATAQLLEQACDRSQ